MNSPEITKQTGIQSLSAEQLEIIIDIASSDGDVTTLRAVNTEATRRKLDPNSITDDDINIWYQLGRACNETILEIEKFD